MKIHSTKSFLNLPCSHRQWFDTNPDGSPGPCSGLHGYDRSVHFTFSGDIDEFGWLFPFGDLKSVRAFLEYYFDHTTVLGADDPGIDTIDPDQLEPGGLLSDLRILPSGVSMEMSSLFVFEHVNPYIYHRTGGRVYISKIEFREHERNSAFIEVSEKVAKEQALTMRPDAEFMPLQPVWEYEKPLDMMRRIGYV